MKSICLLLLPALLMVASCGDAGPVNADPESHQEVVDRSRKERTIVISLDTIFNTGVPYAVIRKAPVILPGRVNGIGANIFSLSGKYLMYTFPVNLNGDHYVSYVFNDGSYTDTAYIAYHGSMLEDARTIVRADLLSRDSINPVQAGSFVRQHAKPPHRSRRRGEMVTRDRDAAITIRGREIWQAGLIIGRYDSTVIRPAGLSFSQFHVYYADTVSCAIITSQLPPSDTSASVVVGRDGISHEVKRGSNRTLLETALWFLVDSNHL